MKRLLPLLLAVSLLCGCAGEVLPGGELEQTIAPGLYDPDSGIEAQTGGAVRAYPLENNGYTWIAAMGESLLLGGDKSGSELLVLSGETCQVTAAAKAPATPVSGGVGFSVTEYGIGYYSASSGEVVFLNKLLQEKNRYPLPKNIQGLPAVNGENDEIYYCVGAELKGFDPLTGITRLIKTQTGQQQTLTGSYFGGKLLSCIWTDDRGTERTVYISTENGQTMSTEQRLTALYTEGERYFATLVEGSVEQQLYGTLQGQQGQINTPEALLPALSMNGALEYTGNSLYYYDLTTGKRTGAVELPGIEDAKGFLADGQKKCVWFLGTDAVTQVQTLYCWEPAASLVFSDTVYAGTLYTLENPDTAGLNKCREQAAVLEETYGVTIRFAQEVAQPSDGDVVVSEHQVAIVQDMLEALEPVLALFPEGFLKASANTLCIDLARSISREQQWLQHWAGGEAHIVLTAGSDLQDGFLRAMGYVVDAHVLGNSVAYDYWSGNNPEGFSYNAAYAEKGDPAYLEGENQAFAEAQAMTSPTEDRSSLFYHAMLEDNADCFQAPLMQKKLSYMCDAIRRAYGLRSDPALFPWEQYLNVT